MEARWRNKDSVSQLPLPNSKKKRQNWLSKPHPSILFIIIFFLIFFFWLTIPQETHVQHDIEAKLDAFIDWINVQITQCQSILPTATLTYIGELEINNPNFEGGLNFWKTTHGSPVILKDRHSKGDNNYWSGGMADKTDIACSSQTIALTNNNNNLENIVDLIDDRSIIVNATCLLKKSPVPAASNKFCGKPNNFCDRNWNDNVWFELDFLVSYISCDSNCG